MLLYCASTNFSGMCTLFEHLRDTLYFDILTMFQRLYLRLEAVLEVESVLLPIPESFFAQVSELLLE